MADIYLEFFPMDQGLRVVAVDAETGLEVVFAAPKNCARERIHELARAKLQRRRRLEGQEPASSDVPQRPVDHGRGRLV
ncbi:MAG: serine hydroxymethyltransferase [Devosiaceae bacterium]|nr:serine hydroxymethyltransferase [Devosiaceae bacterium MH13]